MVKHAAKDGNACGAGERNIRFPSPVRKSVATVYLVDDDAALLFALSCRLREADFAVKTFLSAAEFLEGWSGEIEVCAVIDVQMPGENGLALQQRLTELGAPIPVVFLSGHGDVSTSVSAMKRGAVDFLTKPVRGDELIQAIECGLARGAAERESRSQRIKWQRRYATLF